MTFHYRTIARPGNPASLAMHRRSLMAPWRRNRWAVILGGAVLLAGGLLLGWDWLVAVGVAPIILSLLPCAAMCALGLCMMPRGKSSCSTGSPAAPNSNSESEPRPSDRPNG